MLEFKTGHDQVGSRLDAFVARQVQGVSRSSIQKLCEQGKVLVNGESTAQNYRLKTQDLVSVDYDPDQKPSEIKLEVIYEDDDCLVINKPSGILTHSKGAFNDESTVASFITNKLSTELTGNRAGIVHRLDRGTSGLIITAKTPTAQTWLQKQFSTRKVKKTYVAWVKGHLEPAEAVIDMPIRRHPRTPSKFQANPDGKPATTNYKVIKSSSTNDLVQLQPETGRTHQLRVHLSQVGHPIVGDEFYGGPLAARLMLHAQNLELTLPNHQRQQFTAPLPTEFNELK